MLESPRPVYQNELYHHGIKGQKWGVRNGPPYPLNSKVHASVVKGRGRGKVGGLFENGSQTRNKFSEYLSKRREKIIDDYTNDYKMSGMNTTSAKKAAKEKYDKRQKLLKRVAIGAGIATGAAIAYKGGRYIKSEFMDKTIKAGKKIQTMSPGADRMVAGDSFYTAYRPQDKAMYKGWQGDGLDGNVYKIRAEVLKDTKVASNRNARKVFDDLYKNDIKFKEAADSLGEAANMAAVANPKLAGNDRYKSFNAFGFMENKNMPQDENIKYARNKFIDTMKKKGYGGIKDINDQRFSGFDTDSAIMFTNPTNYNIKATEVSKKSLRKYRPYFYGRAIKNQLMSPGNSAATAAALGGAYSAVSLRKFDKRKLSEHLNKKKRKKR